LHRGETGRLRVAERNPLVLQRMVLSEVDGRDVKVVLTDQLIS
jgi:hypothetical protein